MLASLLFLEYFLISQHIKKKSKSITKKTESTTTKTETEFSPAKKRVATIYAILFLAFLAAFLFSYNLFWVLLAGFTLLGYNIAKKQQAIKKMATKADKEAKSKEVKSAIKKPAFFNMLVRRKLTEEEIKEKEALNRKLREVKLAEKQARIEKIEEKKRLKELAKKINAERRLREKGLKAKMREKKLKDKAEYHTKKKLEKENRMLERLESEKRKIIDEEAKLEKIQRATKASSADNAKESTIQVKDRYETDLDKLVGLVDRYDRLKLSEVAEIFKIDEKIAEEWAAILEQHNLLTIHYPAIGKPELMKVKK